MLCRLRFACLVLILAIPFNPFHGQPGDPCSDTDAIFCDGFESRDLAAWGRAAGVLALAILEPDGLNDVADSSFTITWSDDVPGRNAEIFLFYDNDRSGADGVPINPDPVSEDDETDSYDWETSAMPAGEYYVYAVLDDGAKAPVISYSHGAVTLAGDRPWRQTRRLLASDAAARDRFGFSVALDGDTAAAGSPLHENDDGSLGAAYVFERHAGGAHHWGEVAKLTPTAAVESFGRRVAVSADTVAVAAPQADDACPADTACDSGALYVFERDRGGAGAWGLAAKLLASDAAAKVRIGTSVALSGDTLVVGTGADTAYVFERNAGAWGEVARLHPTDVADSNRFGMSVAVYGDVVAVGADLDDEACPRGEGCNAGSVYVFERHRGGADAWGRVTKLFAADADSGDNLGFSLALDATTLLAGATFGKDAGRRQTGAAYVFERDHGGPNAWGQVKKLLASDAAATDAFGWSVGLSAGRAVVAAYLDDDGGEDAGAVYVFERDHGATDAWGEVTQLLATDAAAGDSFGYAAALSVDTIVVGAREDDAAGSSAGAAYVFTGPPGLPPPVLSADAGSDQTAPVGSRVELDATGSSRVSTAVLRWSFLSAPGGSTPALSDPTSLRPSFVADLPGDYTLELRVNEPYTDTDTVTVTAAAALTTFRTDPIHGEDEVAVTRETLFFFSNALAPGTVVDDTVLFAEFGGARLATTRRLSVDRRQLTLFYDEPLPASARIRVTLIGDTLLDREGHAVDADGDGTAGGAARIDFDTLSLSRVPNTDVWGYVYDSYTPSRPVVGATIRVDGFPAADAVTDAGGYFLLEDMPAPVFFVHIDGGTATNAPQGTRYPNVGKAFYSVAGQSAQLTMDGATFDVFLPPMALADVQPLAESAATDVGFGTAGRAELTDMFPSVDPSLWELTTVRFAPGAAVDDRGTAATEAAIVPVPPDRIPAPLPSNLDPELVISIQAGEATNFDVPAAVCFPNLPNGETGEILEPGTKSELLSFNHDAGRWEARGPMTVSADGRTVCTDAGVGVLAPGWHIPISPVPLRPSAEVSSQDDEELISGWEEASGFFSSFAGLIKLTDRPCRNFMGTGIDAAIEGYTKYQQCLKNAYACTGQVASNAAIAGTSLGGALNTGLGIAKFAGSELFSVIKDGFGGDDSAPSPNPTVVILEERTREVSAQIPSRVVESRIRLSYDVEPAKPFEVGDGAQVIDLSDFDLAALSMAQLTISEVESPTQVVADLQVVEVRQISPELLATLVDAVPGNAPPYSVAYMATVARPSGIFELRGETDPFGNYQLFVPADGTLLTLTFYDPLTNRYGVTLPVATNRRSLPRFTLVPVTDDFVDFDRDGLADLVENVYGTAFDDPDTDGDGLLDGVEVEQGTDPLGGLQVTTGIIAGADTPGTAVDVCALSDLAAVADLTHGISVFSAADGRSPTVIARVDTSGMAQAVSCAPDLVAVADGPGGLAVVDISDPPDAAILHQVSFSGAARAVATVGNIAYVGLDSGELASVDMLSGTVLDRLELAAAVQDVAIGNDSLYVVTLNDLHALPLLGAQLEIAATTRFPGSPTRSSRLRLFAGTDVLYGTHGSGYHTFDLQDPLNPVLTGTGNAAQVDWKGMVTNGNGLGIVAAGPSNLGISHLSLYDVSDPLRTDVFLTRFDTPGRARAVAVYNGLAYVADGTFGLQVVNYQAYDGAGIAPTVGLETNFPDGLAEEGQILRLAATVVDDVQVRSVEFLVDGERVVTDGNFPFEHRFVAPLLSRQPTLSVRARAVDTGGNTASTEEIVLTLTPDAIAPQVSSLAPLDGSEVTGVETLSAFFDEPIDPGTLAEAAFSLVEAGPDQVFDTADDVTLAGGTLEYREDVLGVFRTFAAPLSLGLYRARIDTAITDLTGNALAAASVSAFTVLSSTAVSGTARLPDGRPVAEADVAVRRAADPQTVLAISRTNTDGGFRVEGLSITPIDPWLEVSVTRQDDRDTFFAKVTDIEPVPGGITDLGLLTLAGIPPNFLGEQKLLASNSNSSAGFGTSAAIDGEYAVVGAPQDDEAATNAGAAYIFTRQGGQREGARWIEQAKLLAADAEPDDTFGHAVAISGDYAVVGAPQEDTNGSRAGAAYVFERQGEAWLRQTRLLPADGVANAEFGFSVAMDGEYVVVGAHQDDDNGGLSGSAYVFHRSGDTWTGEAKLLAGDGSSTDYFGAAVAIDGAYALIGARRNSEGSTQWSGSAYVYRRAGSTWSEEAKLRASDASYQAFFGSTVGLSGDSAVIGSAREQAYVFRRSGETWTEQSKLIALDPWTLDRFGTSVAIQGDYAVIGARQDDDQGGNSGSAYVFRRFGDQWSEYVKLVAGDGRASEEFGTAVAISGEQALVGVPRGSPDAYVYSTRPDQGLTTVSGSVVRSDSNTAPDGSPAVGAAVSVLGPDGRVRAQGRTAENGGFHFEQVLVPNPALLRATATVVEVEGSINTVFEKVVPDISAVPGGITDLGTLTLDVREVKIRAGDGKVNDNFGQSVAVDGDFALVGSRDFTGGSTELGAVHVFQRTGDTWVEQAKLMASDGTTGDHFGDAIAIDGTIAIIGAPLDNDRGTQSGSAYVFQRQGTAWLEQAKLTAGDAGIGDFFGTAVAVSGNDVIVGAFREDANGIRDAGSAYVFHFDGTNWVEQAKLNAIDAALDDFFGESVGISGDVAIVGAERNSDAGTFSGSAYVFERNGSTWTERAKLTAGDAAAQDVFGGAVAIDGDVALVAASGDGSSSGSVYVFERLGGTWQETAKLTAGDGHPSDRFGESVAIDGDRLVVGANLDDDVRNNGGAAYVFERQGTVWVELRKLVPLDLEAGDTFGKNVALSATTILVGSVGDDDKGIGSGAAYIVVAGPRP